MVLNLDLLQTKSLSDPLLDISARGAGPCVPSAAWLPLTQLCQHSSSKGICGNVLDPGVTWLRGMLHDQGLNSCLTGSVSCTVMLKLLLSSSSQAASVLAGTLNVIT